LRILFCILVIFIAFAYNTNAQVTSTIKLKYTTREYCLDPVLVAEGINIVGFPDIKGMKISISQGFVSGEDELIYTGALSQSQPSPGTLELTGSTDVRDYVAAIGTIIYKNSKTNPTVGVRKITISLNDVDYLPETGHFYRYVSDIGISWNDAKAKAESTSYYGLKGYLATITSLVENEFIKSKTKGVGWIGASDAAVEGVWRWVTGPEASEDGIGRLFWNGKGLDYRNGVAGTGPYLGRYNNWNTDEPNETGNNEDYAHILFFINNPGASLKWNDLPNAGGNGEYSSKGYLIEFGGMEDVVLDLTATVDLQVNTMSFYKSGIQPAVCEGTSVMLNQADPTNANYIWTPATLFSSPSNIANPVATPTVPLSIFSVTGTRGNCPSLSTTYTIPVNPKPVSKLNPVENICTGQTKTLDPGLNPGYTYLWNNGSKSQTITANTAGIYSVTITSDKLCPADFKTEVVVHKYPAIDLSNLQKLICGDTKTTIVDIKTNVNDYTLTSTDNRANVSGLNVAVQIDGIYPMKFTANHQYCPIHEDFSLSFYKNPKGVFTVNGQLAGQKCFGYNLDAGFTPEGDLIRANYEWEFGGFVIANGIGLNTQVVPLGVSLLKRDLKLTVSQDGCFTTFIKPDILVIPNLSLTSDKNLGCEPLDVMFTAQSSGAIKFDWDFGDKNVLSGITSDQKHTYQNSGFYDLKLKVTTGDGCTNEAKVPKMVRVAPIPDVKFSLSAADCLEPGVNEISYAGLIGTIRDKYYWDLSQFDPSEIVNDPLLTQGPLKFNLKSKPKTTLGLKVITEFGCESKPLLPFVIKRKPEFTIQSDETAACVPFEPTFSGIINVSDLVDKVNFNWDFGDGTTGSGSPKPHIYTSPGKKYNVTLNGISSVTGCANTVTNNNFIETFPKPTAAFSMDHQIVYNDQPDVKFTDQSLGASAWFWNFGESTSDLQNPTFHFLKMGGQRVVLTVTNTAGCTDEIADTVLVAFDRLFPPNGFSPNAPNSIDRVFLLNSDGIAPEGYHFTVLSRWNDVVFEVKDEIKGWDGRTANGNFAPPGAYVWILNFTDFIGRKHRQTGTVTLVY